jgi:hypothetical protein
LFVANESESVCATIEVGQQLDALNRIQYARKILHMRFGAAFSLISAGPDF